MKLLSDECHKISQLISQATSHYLSQCWPRSMSPCGTTTPQCAKWRGANGITDLPEYHKPGIGRLVRVRTSIVRKGDLVPLVLVEGVMWHQVRVRLEQCPAEKNRHYNMTIKYRQISNISRTLVGNKFVDHSDVVGASPAAAAPTTSSFLT